MEKPEKFELKKWVLLNTEEEVVGVDSCQDDGKDGLDVHLSVYTDDMMLQFDSREALLDYLMGSKLGDDGQIVRFCDYMINKLTEICSAYFYECSEWSIDHDENDLFDHDSAHYNIPRLISEIADRLHVDVKEQIELEDKEFQEEENE